MFSFNLKKGFTLIEILFVIAILAILSAMALTSFAKFGKKYTLVSASDKTIAFIEEAKSKTLSSENATRYGVHFETDSITLFSENYVLGNLDNKVYKLGKQVKVSNISLGGGNNIVFEKLSGETSSSGTITISLIDDSQSRVIEIQPTGNVFIVEN